MPGNMAKGGMLDAHGAMRGMGIIWLLAVVLLVLGVAALVKYLLFGRGR